MKEKTGKMQGKRCGNRAGVWTFLYVLFLLVLLPAGRIFAEELEVTITSGVMKWNKIPWANVYHYSVRFEDVEDEYGTTTSLSVDIDAYIDGLIEAGKIKNTGEHQLYMEAYNTETFETITWWSDGPYKHFHPTLPPYEEPEGPVTRLADSANYDSSTGILSWSKYSNLAKMYWCDVSHSGSQPVSAEEELSVNIQKMIDERVSDGSLDYSESFLIVLTANKNNGTELDRWQKTISCKPNITPVEITGENSSTAGIESEYEYTGTAIQPKPLNVIVNSKVLKEGTDFTVSYGSNTEPGTGYVKLTGKGKYTGSVKISFLIVKTMPPITASVSGGTLSWKAYSGAESYSYGAAGHYQLTSELSTDIHAFIDELISKGTIPKTSSYLVEVEALDGEGKKLQNWSKNIIYDSSALIDTSTADVSEEVESTPAAPSQTAVRSGSDIYPEKPAKLAAVQKSITTAKNDKDTKGSTYSFLQARGVAKSRTSIQITWKKVKGAKKYIIYGNRCGPGKKYKKLDTLGKSKTSWTKKKLKKGTYYKVIVAAVSGKKVLAVSRTIHVATNGGRNGNPVSVSLSRQKVVLAVGKKRTVKAVVKPGKLPVLTHRKVAWESDDAGVAKVSSKGKITGVGKGTCHIYAYAQNGICACVEVTVE